MTSLSVGLYEQPFQRPVRGQSCWGSLRFAGDVSERPSIGGLVFFFFFLKIVFAQIVPT